MPEHLTELFSESEYPWEIIPKIKQTVERLIFDGIYGYTLYRDGVLVGRNVKIYPNVVIDAPCVIGGGTELRPGAFIRGSVIIGENCVIGNSTEIKNSIILDNSQAPHYNYIGDSVIGRGAHLGAGVICSNLKSGGGDVVVHGDCDYVTGLRKLGAILADGADIGCGTVLNPGCVIGMNTSVYPNLTLRGTFPAESIVKANHVIVERKSDR